LIRVLLLLHILLHRYCTHQLSCKNNFCILCATLCKEYILLTEP
jgi:hypothetical protein